MKPFNCLLPVLSVSFSLSLFYLLHQYTGLHNSAVKQPMPLPTLLLLYRFWLTEICICCKPHPTRDKMHDLQIELPTTLMLLFFYTSGTLHARHICAIFELWGRLFCSSLLFFSFGVATKGIQFTQLRCHISFLSFTWLTTCFLSSCGRLLKSCKRQLFCLHIQHATCYFFEWRTPVGPLEVAVCRFCLSISLQKTYTHFCSWVSNYLGNENPGTKLNCLPPTWVYWLCSPDVTRRMGFSLGTSPCRTLEHSQWN